MCDATLEAVKTDVTKGIRYITEIWVINSGSINSIQTFSLYLKDDQLVGHQETLQ